VLDLWLERRFTLITSDDILAEYLTVLQRPKFHLPPEVIEVIAAYLYRYGEMVTTIPDVSGASPDPKDDRFWAAALAGDADVIVSGDHHLLQLISFHNIPIQNVREFLEQFSLP
jgi:putative PIN family toxin of toxin-antitoxin system